MKYKLAIVLPFFDQMGIHRPETEYVFHKTRKWRFDFAWPEHKVALEVEGGAFAYGRHTRPSGFKKDMEKYNQACLYGWRVFRTLPENLCTLDLAELLKAALSGAQVESI